MNESRTELRRRDRAVEDDGWIRSFLHRAPVGHLATVDDGQPFINSNLFVYDEPEHAIYLHTARTGRTRSNLEVHERVSFAVAAMGRLLPADVALEFSVEFAGVHIFGRGSIVVEQAEAEAALQAMMDKYFGHLEPGRDYRAIVPEELRRTAVYRVTIEEWSGKRKKERPDFAGAFLYDHAWRETIGFP